MHIKEPQTPQLPAPKAGGSEGKRGDLRRSPGLGDLVSGGRHIHLYSDRAIEPARPLLGGGTSAREGVARLGIPCPSCLLPDQTTPHRGGAVKEREWKASQ